MANQYEGEEGLKVSGGKSAVLDKPDYSTKSDEDILGVDGDAPELGDLGPIDKDGQPSKDAATTKQADKGPRTVKVDDENRILEEGDDDQPAKPEAKADDELTDEEKAEKAATEEQAKAAEEKPPEPLTPLKVSEELKAHFADPKVGKELKTAFYQAAAYREIFPDFQQAKEIAELFPNAEEAKHVSEAYAGFRELQEAYEGSPAEFVNKLHEEGAEEFLGVAEAIFEKLPELHPDTYSRIGKTVLADTLAYCLDHAAEIARESGLSDTNLIAAANVIAMNLFGGKSVRELMTAAADPRDQKISKLETDLKKERSSKSESSFNTFLGEVLNHADQTIDKGIEQVLTAILDVEGTAITKAARQKIGEEIKAEVTAAIKANRRVSDAVVDTIKAKGGDFGQGHLKKASEPIVQQANLLIRRVAAKVVPHYTREILATHEQKINKQRQAAERRDIGNGGGPRLGERGSPITSDQVDYSRTSDEDLLNDRITLKR
jgi:hypothetical protein